MKKLAKVLAVVPFLGLLLLTSCAPEDTGPYQPGYADFAIIGFDKLDMGDAMNIVVQEGPFFSVSAEGDRRNLDDLSVRKEGSTLVIRYYNNRYRNYDTHIYISMPNLKRANLSGASNSRIYGFEEEEFQLYLSGASIAQLDIDVTDIDLDVSGASELILNGVGERMVANLSGASSVNTFDFYAEDVTGILSGASRLRTFASGTLDIVASGASVVYYQGDPEVSSILSGSSTVHKY